jgi:hypothetical protein
MAWCLCTGINKVLEVRGKHAFFLQLRLRDRFVEGPPLPWLEDDDANRDTGSWLIFYNDCAQNESLTWKLSFGGDQLGVGT